MENHPQDQYPDPIGSLSEAPPGTLLYGIAADESDALQIEVLIRESDDVLDQMPAHPELAMRAGVVTTRRIPVPVVLFRFAPKLPAYASFWNHYHPSAPGEPSALECMEAEPRELIFKLIGDSGHVRSLFSCRHPLGEFFRNARMQAAALPPWTDDDFRKAVAEVHERFPDSEALWNAFLG